MLNGVLWFWAPERNGGSCRRSTLPVRHAHRRFQQWVCSGILEQALRLLAEWLRAEGRLNLEEAFIDATFAAAKKGGLGIGPTKRSKGTNITAISAGDSLPIAVNVQAAPSETQLVEEALGNSFLDQLPARLIGDKAYDNDPLDHHLRTQYEIEMIAPHRGERKCPTQDGRALRRYRRRWTVKRLFA